MSKLTADLNNGQKLVPFEKGDYPARILKHEVGSSKNNPRYQMITVHWKPEGPKAGDNLGTARDWVAYDGFDKNGDPVNIEKLCQYLNALNVPWECKNCGKESTAAFQWQSGKPFCPSCGTQAAISFDPDLWDGKRATIRLDIGKMPNSDEETNNVKRIMPIS